MKRGASKKLVSSTEDEVQRRLESLEPKRQFLDAALNMSWQLAFTVIVPVVIGVQLDSHFKTAPSYTIVSFFIAVMMAGLVVRNTLKGITDMQIQVEKEDKEAKK